jgi:hypothetical protein
MSKEGYSFFKNKDEQEVLQHTTNIAVQQKNEAHQETPEMELPEPPLTPFIQQMENRAAALNEQINEITTYLETAEITPDEELEWEEKRSLLQQEYNTVSARLHNSFDMPVKGFEDPLSRN